MACFLAFHPSQTQTSVSLFTFMSIYCPANAPAALPCADSLRPTNSNTQTLLDDDDLPPVSEALALPSHLIQKPGANTTIPQIPRVTVRATTSDGKTIYLRKRKKPSPTVSRWCIRSILTYKDVLRLRQLKRWEICFQFPFTDLWMGCQLPRQKICNASAY
jgi:hypothetical protein